MSTPPPAREHRRPIRALTWLPRRIGGEHGTASITTYTLLLGNRTVTAGQVDARVMASAGYGVGHLQTPEHRRAASLPGASADRPGSVEAPAVYVAEGPTAASAWRRADDLSVEAYDDTVPALRFTSRSGQPMPSELHDAVDRAELVLVVTEGKSSCPRAGTWRAVVLLPAA